MSAGSVILKLRALIRDALPYLAHSSSCAYRAGGACSCGLEAMAGRLRRATMTSAANTGGPNRHSATRRDVRRVMLLALAIGAGSSSCSSATRVVGGTTVYVRDTVRLAPIQLPPDTLPRVVVQLPPDSIRPAAIVLAPDTVRPAPVVLAPDTVKPPTIRLAPDTVRPAPIVLVPDTVRSTIQLPPDTVRAPRVVLPPDTVKPPPVILPPDTVRAAPGTPELPRYMTEMDAMLKSARAADTVTRRVFDLVGKTLVPRMDPATGRQVCNRIVVVGKLEQPEYFPCPDSVPPAAP